MGRIIAGKGVESEAVGPKAYINAIICNKSQWTMKF